MAPTLGASLTLTKPSGAMLTEVRPAATAWLAAVASADRRAQSKRQMPGFPGFWLVYFIPLSSFLVVDSPGVIPVKTHPDATLLRQGDFPFVVYQRLRSPTLATKT